MRRIELGDFLLIAEIHTGIAAEQLARMSRVVNLAEAALAAPFAGFGDYEAFPAIHEKAAVVCARVIAYHPLPDGNKRTAYDVLREFLERNGADFEHPAEGLDGTAAVIERLASGEFDEAAFVEWVEARLGSHYSPA